MLLVCVCVFALPVYLLLGLVFVLVVLETCCELPQIRYLKQRFYKDKVRELDSETTNIINQDHLSDQLTDPSDHVKEHNPPSISSVSEQAASLRQNGKSLPYTPASGSANNRKLRWLKHVVFERLICKLHLLLRKYCLWLPPGCACMRIYRARGHF